MPGPVFSVTVCICSSSLIFTYSLYTVQKGSINYYTLYINWQKNSYFLITDLLYATPSQQREFEQLFLDMENDPICGQYEKVMSYLKRMEAIKEDWCLFYRQSFDDCPDRGHRTNNMVERSFLRLKNEVLERTKCGSVPQLAEHVSIKLCDKYRQVIMTRISSTR